MHAPIFDRLLSGSA